jgi:ATP-binding cassette subfamily D (ALD) protein 3
VPRLLTGLLQLQRSGGAVDAAAASRNQFLAAAAERVLGSAGKLSSLAESVASLLSSSQRVIELLDVADQMHRARRLLPSAAASADATAIEVRHVDVVTPDGCCLMQNLSLSVAPGQSLFVSGVNGSGKTSLFRVMAGLWPARGPEAAVVRPASLSLVPQRAYAFGGSLAQQVTYPRTDRSEDRARIEEALELAGIGYLAGRFDKGLDTAVAWEDTLSLGEQQRLGFARLYYQLPAFVVLDECTDAVSVDQEERLYRLLLERNITCITISKRLSQSLAKFHSQHLRCGNSTLAGFELSQIEK